MHVEAATVRQFCNVLFGAFFAIALIAAGPAASILGTPTVLVFPFAVNGGDVTKEAGSRLAVTIATQIANLGGVNVKPAPPGIERQSYLGAARHETADYYITGYVTPLGDGVSVVEQLVSTQTGIVVFSYTAQIRTFEDATSQGDVLREALLRHQSRNLGAYAAPPPPAANPSPTAAPGDGSKANLGRLFGRKQRRATQPSPTPGPTAVALSERRPAAAASSAAPAVAPSSIPAQRGSTYGVLAIGGPAETDRRSFTLAAIRNVMIAKHQRVASSVATSDVACSDRTIGTLLGGNLATRYRTILGQPQTLATLELLAYDCTGSVVYRKTFARDARGDWKNAVDRVVQSAVAEFLHEPPGARGS